MAKYRNRLPQLEGGTFLSDGGMETTLIFHDGVDLPHFASFVLLATPDGRQRLRDYYRRYLDIAARHGTGFILDTATWRSSSDWGLKLDFDARALWRINEIAVELVAELRDEYERPGQPIVISGAVGPRGDGYKAGVMTPIEAEEYHGAQIAAFAGSETDMVNAVTMNNIQEAIGIVRAARRHDLPCAISFTVETDGRLVGGDTLKHAIESVDRATGGYPHYFMINCCHPSHFDGVLDHGSEWVSRIAGVRANASMASHAELDDSDTLDDGDIADLSRRYRNLVGRMPHLRVLGGCCGTDHRHIAAICEACLSTEALNA